jgi:hypothetical protein
MGNIVSNIEEIQANIINNKINDNKSVPIQINNQISSTSTYNTPQSINNSSQNNINKNTNNLKTTLSHNSLYSLCSNSSFTNSIVNKCVGNINISNSNNSNNNISNYNNDNLDIDCECDANVND